MFSSVISIDKAYIDKPYGLFLRRLIDNLLVVKKELLWPNRTAYALLLLVLIIKVSHETYSLEKRKLIPAFVLEPPGPSMHTLSMVISDVLSVYFYLH